ncbi:hypothetical protein ACHWQZ_G017571 [Mnemiopsis leidyi]
MLLVLLLAVLVSSCSAKREFYIDWENDRFVKDGETFQYVSAGMHYFRIPHQYWEQRISAAKSAGLNAVQTYVAWNAHEPQPGNYNFEGDLDIVRFIKQVQAQDMALILRVGPYICAEWNFGGLPPWLLGRPYLAQVKTSDKGYMVPVIEWLRVLGPMIKPLLYANGGPIIMIQVENEYGSFGCDHNYISDLANYFQEFFGPDIIYFTTDGPGGYKCGSLPGTEPLFTTIDFGVGSDAAADFAKLRIFQPHGPSVNSEFYTGWLDHWKHGHSKRAADKLGVSLDELLALNASVNLYMWHGGTNFGLSSGAQYRNGLIANPTSYDYDAPQSEWGDVKLDKYWAIRNVTEKYFPGNKMPVPQDSKKLGGISVKLRLTGLLVDQIGPKTLLKKYPLPHFMEELGVFEGIVAYQHEVTAGKPLLNVELQLLGVHDRAYVLTDGNFVQVVKREEEVKFNVTAYKTITILVENMGYIGFSKAMSNYDDEYKGLKNVTVNGCVWTNWNHYRINVTDTSMRRKVDMEEVANLSLQNQVKTKNWQGKDLLPEGPAVFSGEFVLDKSQLLDTFVNITESWSKGYLIVNNKLIGRYWPDAGPQYTLYLPGVWLREGTNTIRLVELQSHSSHPPSDYSVYLTDKPYIDGPVNPDA